MLLVSYANTYADVGDHVVFGVDPPVIEVFFLLLSLGFGRIFRINPRIRCSPGQEPVLKPRCRCLIIPAPHYLWAGCGGHRPPENCFTRDEGRTRGGALPLGPALLQVHDQSGQAACDEV